MPPDASKTRAGLLDAAARAFAHDGVFNASLIDITRQAGQRNRAALRYHFGSRDGVLCAVIGRHAEFLARREGELLEVARRQTGLESVIEALVHAPHSVTTVLDLNHYTLVFHPSGVRAVADAIVRASASRA